ncbi:pyridoxamine 5'-phosphate oxidase family protein [Streptomyces sp. T028]|uniref:pyridoxamine 5'-phosphate oxidase family protein n=1 Tax=Streptomyces sp. T028 TaxID=3394379 RepID=UPI003A89463A
MVTFEPIGVLAVVILQVMPSDISSQTLSYSAFWSEYHLCTLTTMRSDGSPHVVPVGVTLDADAGIARVITRKSSKKVANIQASRPGEARVAVCQVDGGRWATLEGTAEVVTDAAAVDDAVARYANRYGRRPGPDPERVVIEITIERAMGLVNHPRPMSTEGAG